MDILRAVRDGALGPTQIMYKANLSWMILNGHLRDMVKNGVLSEQEIKGRMTYVLTERGISVLRSYLEVVERFELPEIDRDSLNGGQPPSKLLTR